MFARMWWIFPSLAGMRKVSSPSTVNSGTVVARMTWY